MNYRLIVKSSQLLFPVLCIFCIFHEVRASVATHNMFLTGIHLACNHRYGYYYLSGNYQSREKLVPVISPGIDFGKRFILTKILFISTAASIADGFTKETLPYSVKVDDVGWVQCDLYKNYVQSGVSSLIHVQVPVKFGRVEFSCAAGGGIFYSGYQEQLREHDGQTKWLIDSYFIKRSKVTGSFDAGFFSELPFLNKNRLCFNYNFRYWQPVRYFVSRDLFPVNSIQYRERFFTQWLGVCILYRNPF